MGDYKYKLRNIGRAADQATRHERIKEQSERSKTYHCISCTRCDVTPTVKTPEECEIVGEHPQIQRVVDVEIKCTIGATVPSLNGKVLCEAGNRDRKSICGNCLYGEPITCEVKSDNPRIKSFTQLHLCRNPHMEEQYSKGTAFKRYVGCEHFAPKR